MKILPMPPRNMVRPQDVIGSGAIFFPAFPLRSNRQSDRNGERRNRTSKQLDCAISPSRGSISSRAHTFSRLGGNSPVNQRFFVLAPLRSSRVLRFRPELVENTQRRCYCVLATSSCSGPAKDCPPHRFLCRTVSPDSRNGFLICPYRRIQCECVS